jgi:hypothetical protein
MLRAICNKHGIDPSTLPGYDSPRSTSPSMSVPSVGSLDPSSAISELPREAGVYLHAYSMLLWVFIFRLQAGEEADPPEEVPLDMQVRLTHVDHLWAGFEVLTSFHILFTPLYSMHQREKDIRSSFIHTL